MTTFRKPWMDNCNPDLIYRLWESKGRPGVLEQPICAGVTVQHIPTIYGVISLCYDPMLMGNTIGDIIARLMDVPLRKVGTEAVQKAYTEQME